MTPALQASEEEHRAAPAPVWDGAMGRLLTAGAWAPPIQGLCCIQQGAGEGAGPSLHDLPKRPSKGLCTTCPGSGDVLEPIPGTWPEGLPQGVGIWGVLGPSSPWGQCGQYQLIIMGFCAGKGPAWSCASDYYSYKCKIFHEPCSHCSPPSWSPKLDSF